MDASDIVDASDFVDGIESLGCNKRDETNDDDDDNADTDFDDFRAAKTLQGETVFDALAAAAIQEGGVSNLDSADSNHLMQRLQEATIIEENDNEKNKNKNDDNKNNNNNVEDNQNNGSETSRFVSPKDFELFKVIGMGAFGKVLQVKNKASGKILAMKIISKRLIRRKSGYIENIQAERNILKKVNHPFVVKMHCSFQTKEKLFIVMDFLAGGELFLRLGREGIFLEKDAAFYLAEIILSLDHLHSLGILHRDLKPENILLCNDGHICLTDFGLAKDFGPNWTDQDVESDRASTICGTQEYMAPEMVARKGYGKAADYWSLGCIGYEMLNGLPPFSSKQGSKELFRKIMQEKVKMPPGTTAAACKLLKGLLNRNPDARLGCARSTMFEVGGVAGLKRVAFFNNIDWGKLEKKEMEPPYKLPVDNDEDLRNFHDDFTNMPLPRSVKEMSVSDDLPRRIKSDTFRGFSFIQDGFVLPDRDPATMDNYWNNEAVNEGMSDSDVASSKCAQEDVATEPEKKKRPPRKRKKKKKNAETGSVVSSAPSETGDVNATQTATATNGMQLPPAKPAVQITGIKEEGRAASPTLASPPKPITPPKPAKDEPVWQSVQQSSGSKKKSQPAAALSATNHVVGMNPSANAFNPTPTRRVAAQSPYHPNGTANPVRNKATAQSTYIPKTSTWAIAGKVPTPKAAASSPSQRPVATPSNTRQSKPAVPGSWAARLGGTPSSVTTEPSRTQPLHAKPAAPKDSNGQNFPPSPSSDWRSHKSPEVQRAFKQSSNPRITQSSPLQNKNLVNDKNDITTPAGSATGGGPPSWPSLAAAGGAAPKKGPTPSQTKKKLIGAWAN